MQGLHNFRGGNIIICPHCGKDTEVKPPEIASVVAIKCDTCKHYLENTNWCGLQEEPAGAYMPCDYYEQVDGIRWVFKMSLSGEKEHSLLFRGRYKNCDVQAETHTPVRNYKFGEAKTYYFIDGDKREFATEEELIAAVDSGLELEMRKFEGKE